MCEAQQLSRYHGNISLDRVCVFIATEQSFNKSRCHGNISLEHGTVSESTHCNQDLAKVKHLSMFISGVIY